MKKKAVIDRRKMSVLCLNQHEEKLLILICEDGCALESHNLWWSGVHSEISALFVERIVCKPLVRYQKSIRNDMQELE